MSDPSDDIMRATFSALCERGYADLTMRHIAEEADCSKASLHYHYDSKQGLMLAFLDHLYEHFIDRVGGFDPDTEDAPADPDARLRAFLDDVLHPPDDGDTVREFRTALLEIQAQSPYDEAFRERIAAFDDHIYGTVHDLISAGVDAGVYRDDADPDEIAQFVLTVVDGVQSRHVVAGEDADRIQSTLESFVDGFVRRPREAPQ